jgi:hypothetical protein
MKMNLDSKCVEECAGCDYGVDGTCKVFLCPAAKFRTGRGQSCGMATHLITRVVDESKKRIGQQKSKKKTRA